MIPTNPRFCALQMIQYMLHSALVRAQGYRYLGRYLYGT